MKRILTIQDISCVGRCSLTVALPVLSAMGLETAALPTAVLSTHTAFTGYTFRDLTDDLLPIAAHWKKEGIAFDAIYTGYLGSFRQLEIVERILDMFVTEQTRVIVDPVMGDFGKLYAGFDAAFAAGMRALCARADVILPNLTEAAHLTGTPYLSGAYTEADIQALLAALAETGAKNALLTGVSFAEDTLGAMAYDARSDRYDLYVSARLPESFHGTGDVFASCVAGAMTRGLPLAEAMRLAVDFTLDCLRHTMADPAHRWYGVNFEAALPALAARME